MKTQLSRKQRSLKRIQLKNGMKAGKEILFHTKFKESLFGTEKQIQQIQTDEINKWWSVLQKIYKVDFKMHCIEQTQAFWGDDITKGECTLISIFQREVKTTEGKAF